MHCIPYHGKLYAYNIALYGFIKIIVSILYIQFKKGIRADMYPDHIYSNKSNLDKLYLDKKKTTPSWVPNYLKLTPPIYSAIAEQLKEDILSGKLPAHTQLPPQRELAEYLNINLSTVTRAFKLCESNGLIYATTGRGTFVSPDAIDTNEKATKKVYPFISMGTLKPYTEYNDVINETTQKILSTGRTDLFDLEPFTGSIEHRNIAQQWLQRYHVDVTPEEIMITAGAQSALQIAMMTLFHPGDRIATDRYTYPNFIQLAKLLDLELIGIAADSEGMLPEQLAILCNQNKLAGIFLMPSCCNPTTSHMSQARRKEIANVISIHNLLLIEDDTYGFLHVSEAITPIRSLIPESTVYIQSLSKCFSQGLRTAYMVCPQHMNHMFLHTASQLNQKLSVLNIEIASQLIVSGDADRLIEKKLKKAQIRNHLFHTYFPEDTYLNTALFQWILLPSDCNGYQFEVQAKDNKIQILCSDHFTVNSAECQPAIRIATCSPATDDELEIGLRILKDLIAKNEFQMEHPDYIE